MTEEEWLSSCKPHFLLWSLDEEAWERKRVLMGCAFSHTCREFLPDVVIRDVIDVVERYADGMASVDELSRAKDAFFDTPVLDGHARGVVRGAVSDLGRWDKHRLGRILQIHRTKQSRAMLCQIVRDVFGNPFRPVAFDPAWRTATTVGLAAAMYESRSFANMPILADALEEAGCDHPDVLAHCRDEAGVHVRGCWVVDLVLGKA